MLKKFSADLHIHTLLSPCGDLEMSPVNIVEAARRKGIDILGITDHNSTRHCRLIRELAAKEGIFVLAGAEVTTKEEVHCLTFFDSEDSLVLFQTYLEMHLPDISNDPDVFGYQVVIDKNEDIVEEVEHLLISALDVNIEEVERQVHSLGGIFIPAHVNKMKNSITSQLGFVPPDLNFEALEISRHTTRDKFVKENPYLKDRCFIQSSDAHYVDNIGDVVTDFLMEKRSFKEILLALNGQNGRKVNIK